ncbi:hypothetical protein [Aliarcobacter butzleri]|nr:hypothetical protein [Aliarcobacter butzleri]MCG3688231.1 hypothetical protein [Aliarcobacter butzleri]BAK70956.1 hypothetical protein ABED_1239 [Aliarcobacter butzleri ED-1]
MKFNKLREKVRSIFTNNNQKLQNLSDTGTKEFEDKTIKQILLKIENMS